jgi:hypothetical protein
VSISVHDAVTGAEVAPNFTVDGMPVTAQCRCTGCSAPGYTDTCGEWTLQFTSTAANDLTYQVVVSAAGYAAQQFSLTIE